MSLIQWSPMFPDWVGDFMNDFPAPKGARNFVPALDMYEDKTNVYVELSLPHVKPDDIDMHIEDGMLVIKGKTEKKSEVNEDNYYLRQISTGSFYRSMSLPVPVNEDKIKADFNDGVLKVIMPKIMAKEKPKKKITITNKKTVSKKMKKK